MKRVICAACASVLFVAATVVPAIGRDDKTPTVKEVMGKLNKGNKAPLAQLKTLLKAKTPDWKKIQDSTKEFADLGPTLSKNEPPKGDPAQFKKLAEVYGADCKDLDDAAKKEDLATTKGAFVKVTGSCMKCHTAHRPR
jgi:cytochrome c556